MRNIASELRRALVSKRMLLALFVGVALLYQPELYLRHQFSSFIGMDLGNAMQCTLGLGSFVILATAICVIPYSDSYAWEAKSKMENYLICRQTSRLYLSAKMIAVALSGGLVLALSFTLFCITQAMLSPSEILAYDAVSSALTEVYLFFLYGVAWATFALGVSSWITSPLIALAASLCVERGSQLLSVTYNIPWLRLSDAIGYQCGSVFQIWQIFVIDTCVLCIGVLLFWLGVRRKKC